MALSSRHRPQVVPPESRRSLALVPSIRIEVCGETTGSMRACKRESATGMARAAGRVAWLFGEPDRGVEGHRDAATRQGARAKAWFGPNSFR